MCSISTGPSSYSYCCTSGCSKGCYESWSLSEFPKLIWILKLLYFYSKLILYNNYSNTQYYLLNAEIFPEEGNIREYTSVTVIVYNLIKCKGKGFRKKSEEVKVWKCAVRVHYEPNSRCPEMAEQFWAVHSGIQRPRGGYAVLYLSCIWDVILSPLHSLIITGQYTETPC